MFAKLKTSWDLVKVSILFIKRDWELLIYSILSLISSIAILITFIGSGYMYFWNFEAIAEQSEIASYIFIFLYYLIFSFITFFFNTAIITSVQRRIEWKDNKFWDWMKDASKHLKEILIWSTINALVWTILKIIQNQFWENSVIWKILINLIGWMWNILTFFSFPLMIINWVWPKEAIKESGSLFKKTWWERAILHVWVWLLFTLIFFLIFLIGIFTMYLWMILVGILFIIIWTILTIVFSSTCDVIIKTILLNFAKTWKLPDGFEEYSSITKITK